MSSGGSSANGSRTSTYLLAIRGDLQFPIDHQRTFETLREQTFYSSRCQIKYKDPISCDNCHALRFGINARPSMYFHVFLIGTFNPIEVGLTGAIEPLSDCCGKSVESDQILILASPDAATNRSEAGSTRTHWGTFPKHQA